MDEFADAYLRGQWSPLRPGADDTGQTVMLHDGTHPAEHLTAVDGITQGMDAPDQARAKLYKATAYAMLGKVQTAEEPALDSMPTETLGAVHALLAQALQLDAQCGVKKDIERIERIERKQRALAAPAKEEAPAPTAASPEAKATATPAVKRTAATKPAAKTTAKATARTKR